MKWRNNIWPTLWGKKARVSFYSRGQKLCKLKVYVYISKWLNISHGTGLHGTSRSVLDDNMVDVKTSCDVIYLLLVCMWRHGGHVVGQERQHFSPLETPFPFKFFENLLLNWPPIRDFTTIQYLQTLLPVMEITLEKLSARNRKKV